MKYLYLYLYLIGVFGCIWQIFFKYAFNFHTLIHNDNTNKHIIFCLFYNPRYLYFIFITFLLWHYANFSVMDTLIRVGIIKMLHKHTDLPLCVLTACGHWTMDIDTELSLIYRPRCTFIYWGLVTPIWWQNSCHHWFRGWLVISLVPVIAWTNYDILSIGTLEVKLC